MFNKNRKTSAASIQSYKSATRSTSTTSLMHLTKDSFTPQKNHQILIWHFIILYQVFVSEMPRGIVLATQPKYIELLGPESNHKLILGIAISCFSIGRLISTLLFSFLVAKTESTKRILFLSTFISIIGTLLYALASFFHSSTISLTLLIASRIIIGIGCGTLGIARAFTTQLSTKSQRTKYLSWNTLLQYIGFSVSPSFALIVSFIFKHEDERLQYGWLQVGFQFCLFFILLLLLFWLPNKDSDIQLYESIPDSEIIQKEEEPASEETEQEDKEEQKIKIAFWIFIFLNFSLRGIVGVIEAFGPKQYELIQHASQQQTGTVFTVIGCCGIFTFLVLPYLEKLLKAKRLLIFGILSLLLGSLLLVPIVSNENVVIFLTGIILMWPIGSPICQTLSISTYSLILGNRKQTKQMGYLTTAGSLGRILFPLLTGLSYTAVHFVDVFACLICLLILIWFYIKFQMITFGGKKKIKVTV